MSTKESNSDQPTKGKIAKINESEAKGVFVRGIIGIVLLTVFGSIAYSTVVIWTGLDDNVSKMLIAPQALFALFVAFVAFSKILK